MTLDTAIRPTPSEAWAELSSGNARFIADTATSPRQDAAHRAATAPEQRPHTAILTCSDSRLAAEILFDQGLGDLFVMRNAGNTVSTSELGSLEFAVAALQVSLILVLSHDRCGAVGAAVDALTEGPGALPPHTADQIQPIIPAVQAVWLTDGQRTPYVDATEIDLALVRHAHVGLCIDEILRESPLVAKAVADGTVAIVGADYELVGGTITTVKSIGVVTA
jgi:carbonic anhydrase